MKAVLVNGLFNIKTVSEPLGLEYLATMLRQLEIDIDLIQPCIWGGNEVSTLDRILQTGREYDIIGISVGAFSERLRTLNLVGSLRSSGYRGLVVVGGHDPSLEYRAYLQPNSGVDCVVVGEGEVTFPRLIECYREGRDYRDLPGIAYLSRKGPCLTGLGERVEDLDQLPFPDRMSLQQYLAIAPDVFEVHVLGGRWCYSACNFCSRAAFSRLHMGSRFRQRSVTNIVDEIELLVQRFGIRTFRFVDDTFMLPGKRGVRRCVEFSQEISRRELNIRFWLQTRPDCVCDESIAALVSCGLREILVGIESFDQDCLDLFNKNITLQDQRNALEVLKRHGFSGAVTAERRLRCGMIPFHPYTSVASLRKLLALAGEFGIAPKRLKNRLELLPSTGIGARLAELGVMNSGQAWDYVHGEVGDVHRAFCAYLRETGPWRDRIRGIEKTLYYFEVEMDLGGLPQHRAWVDEQSFLLMDDLLGIVEREGQNGAFDRVLQKYLDRARVYCSRNLVWHEIRQKEDMLEKERRPLPRWGFER